MARDPGLHPSIRRQRQLGISDRQGGVQEVDIVSLVKPITKYAVTIDRPENVRRCLEEALWHMKNGRNGPVWLDVPLDIQADPIDPKNLAPFVPPEMPTATINLSEQIEQINALIKDAKRPLFLIGHGVRISGATDLFRELAEKLNIPCVFIWNAADTFECDYYLYIWPPGVVAARATNFAIQNNDCLCSIGFRLDKLYT